MEEFVGTISAA